jgi:hypothetical protein
MLAALRSDCLNAEELTRTSGNVVKYAQSSLGKGDAFPVRIVFIQEDL